MTAKQYLRQIRRLDNIVNSKLEEVYTLRSLATKITTAPSLTNVQTSPQHDKTGGVVAKIVDLERDINATVDQLIDLKKEIIAKIDGLENYDHKLLLSLRYINFKTWEEIAVNMGYTHRHTLRLHGQALIDFQKHVIECHTHSVI